VFKTQSTVFKTTTRAVREPATVHINTSFRKVFFAKEMDKYIKGKS